MRDHGKIWHMPTYISTLRPPNQSRYCTSRSVGISQKACVESFASHCFWATCKARWINQTCAIRNQWRVQISDGFEMTEKSWYHKDQRQPMISGLAYCTRPSSFFLKKKPTQRGNIILWWLLKQPYSCTDPSEKKEKHILSWSSCQWIKRPRFESKLKVNEKGDCWYSSRKRNKQLLHTKLGPCKSAIQYITCNAYQFTIVTEQTFRANNLCYHRNSSVWFLTPVNSTYNIR